MTITPEQCRAARSLLDWDQEKLVDMAGVKRRTVYSFEFGDKVSPETVEKIRIGLESGGVVFLDDDEGRYKSGVALKPDYIAPKREKKGKKLKKTETEEEKRQRLSDYWKDRPEGLAVVSEQGQKDFAAYLRGENGEDQLGKAAE